MGEVRDDGAVAVQVEAGLEGWPAVLGGLDVVGALDLLGSSLGDGAALGG